MPYLSIDVRPQCQGGIARWASCVRLRPLATHSPHRHRACHFHGRPRSRLCILEVAVAKAASASASAPALPCPALPCPALPCPALPSSPCPVKLTWTAGPEWSDSDVSRSTALIERLGMPLLVSINSRALRRPTANPLRASIYIVRSIVIIRRLIVLSLQHWTATRQYPKRFAGGAGRLARWPRVPRTAVRWSGQTPRPRFSRRDVMSPALSRCFQVAAASNGNGHRDCGSRSASSLDERWVWPPPSGSPSRRARRSGGTCLVDTGTRPYSRDRLRATSHCHPLYAGLEPSPC